MLESRLALSKLINSICIRLHVLAYCLVETLALSEHPLRKFLCFPDFDLKTIPGKDAQGRYLAPFGGQPIDEVKLRCLSQLEFV